MIKKLFISVDFSFLSLHLFQKRMKVNALFS